MPNWKFILRAAFFTAVAVLSASPGSGQSPNDIGVRPVQSYDGDHESIGLANGNVNISIPLVKRKERNGETLSISLSYNSSTWFPSLEEAPVGNGLAWTWTQPETSPTFGLGGSGWQLSAPQASNNSFNAGTGSSVTYSAFAKETSTVAKVNGYAQSQQPFYTWVGVDDQHERVLSYQGGPVGRILYPDGSQYLQIFDSSNLSHTRVLDRNGNATDYTSNILEATETSTPQTATITDAGGRVYVLSVQQAYDAQGYTIISSGSLAYQDTNGNPAQAKLLFGISGTVDDGVPSFTNPSGSIVSKPSAEMKASMLSAIVLANGLTYTFHYNEYLELTKIGYPTGGYTRYDYTPYTVGMYGYVSNYQSSSGAGPAFMVGDYRQVSARHVCPVVTGGYKQTMMSPGNTCTVPELTTSYQPTVTGANGANQSNLITYPDNSSVEHIFFPSSPGDCHSVTPVSFSDAVPPTARCDSPDLATITRDSNKAVVASTTALYGDPACPTSTTEISSVIGPDLPTAVGLIGYTASTGSDPTALVSITDFVFDEQSVSLPAIQSNGPNQSVVAPGMTFDLCHVTKEYHYASGAPPTGKSNAGANLAFMKVRSWMSSGIPQNTLGQTYGVPATGDYATPWNPDLISSEQTQDPQGNTLASTSYFYDNYGVLGQNGLLPTNAVQHGALGFTEPYCTVPVSYNWTPGDPTCSGAQNESTFTVPAYAFDQSMTARGNVTETDRLVGAASNPIRTLANYDDTGNVVKSADAAGNVTQVSYLDSWSQSACAPSSGQSNAYPSSKTSPTGLVTAMTYTSCDGSLASTENPNHELVTMAYDTLGRLTSLQEPAPNGGSISNCYSDITQGICPSTGFPLKTTVATQIDSSTSASKELFLDGLGRTVETASSDPYGSFYNWTDFDNMGRPSVAYVPSRGASSHPSSQTAATVINYDALGRVSSVQNPSDSQTPASTRYQNYNGPSTQLQDEDGRKRLLIFDGLGRLVSVCEPGSPSDTPSMQNAPSSPRCANSNFETDYTYSGLGDLIAVQQFDNLGNSVSRSFQYDWLSRLVYSQNPESGSIRYSYVNANGGLCSGDASLPCSTTDARGLTRTFSYDAENRLVQKTYSDQTPTATYNYGMNSQANIHAAGRLTSETTTQQGQTATSRIVNLYDSSGRVANETQCVYSFCDNLSLNWDFVGNLRSQSVGSTGTNLTTLSYHVNTGTRVDGVSSDWLDPQHPNLLFQETAFDPVGVSSSNMSGSSTNSFAIALTENKNVRGWTTSGGYTGAGLTQAAVPATAQVAFSVSSNNSQSSTSVLSVDLSPGFSSIPDSGGLLLFVSNAAVPVQVSYSPSSTLAGIAQQFAAAIGTACTDPSQNQPSGYVTAVAQGNRLIVTDCPAAQGDVSIRVGYAWSTASDNSTNPSMYFPVSTGGNSGTVQVSANGVVQATYNYAASDSSTIDVASQLAGILSTNGGILSGHSQGGTLTLSSRAPGATGNSTSYSVIIISSSGSSQFSVSPASGSLTGGSDAGYGPITVYNYALNSYRPNGNLTGMADSLQGSWNYQYDQLNRLQGAGTSTAPYSTNASNPTTISWLYDAFGNRTNQTLSGSATFSMQQPTATFTGNRANYGTNYDAAGNVTQTSQTVYDAEERLASFNGTGYIYDAEGNCVGKTLNCALESIFVLGAAGQDLTEKDGSGNWRHTDVAGPSGMLGTYDANGVHYFLSDWQGTRRMQANAAGAIEGYFHLCRSESRCQCPPATHPPQGPAHGSTPAKNGMQSRD